MKATKWMAAAFLVGSMGLIAACGDSSGNSNSSGGGYTASNKGGYSNDGGGSGNGGGVDSSSQTGNDSGSDPGYKKYCASQGKEPLGDWFGCESPQGKKDCSDWENCCSREKAMAKGGEVALENGSMPTGSFSGGVKMKFANVGEKCKQ
ncbi:MAG: hypothetical protein AAF471_07560 [Myxococcota bacterium]